MTVLYFHPTGPPSIAHMQAWPVHLCLAVLPSVQRLTLTPFASDFLMCISRHLFVILDLFSISSSFYRITSVVSLVLVSTTYANSVLSANYLRCVLSRFWFML